MTGSQRNTLTGRLHPLNLMISLAASVVLASLAAINTRAQEAYKAILSGGDMNPPTESQGTGVVQITVLGPTAFYQVTLSGIPGVESVQIQVEGGTAPPGYVMLYEGPPIKPIDGVLLTGAFSAADVRRMSWDQFMIAVWIGRAWVEVHTKQRPNGEITGRLVRVPSKRPIGAGPLVAVEAAGTR